VLVVEQSFERCGAKQCLSGTLIQLSASNRFAKTSFSLDSVKLVNALHAARFDWSLPALSRLSLLLFIAITLVPSALWAGSLTPALTTKKTTSSTIQVPYYRNASGIGAITEHGPTPNNSALGLFTFDPERELQGLVLQSAEGASTVTNNQTIHAKLDRTKYSYINRSYGVGASAGLADSGLSERVTAYTYNETGFISNTSCIFNSSAVFTLQEASGQPDNWLLRVFEAVGQLPNNPPGTGIDFVTADISGGQTIIAVAASLTNESNYLGIATNGDFYPFNNTQCVVTFTETQFEVSVNVVNQTVSVLPLNITVDLTHGQNQWLRNSTVVTLLTHRAVNSLTSLSQELSTAIYVNPLGNAFMDNMAALNSTSPNYETTILQSIENVFASLLDNAMVSYATAQMMLLNDTSTVAIVTATQAYTFAASIYVYPLQALNFIICCILIFEAIRTRNWRNLPRFEFMDIKSVIVAASEGGSGIAEQLRALRQKAGVGWSSSEDSRLAGGIKARLGVSEEDGRAAIMAVGMQDIKGGVSRGSFEDVAFHDDTDVGFHEDEVPLRNMGAPVGLSP
jgi:hypothetical protein